MADLVGAFSSGMDQLRRVQAASAAANALRGSAQPSKEADFSIFGDKGTSEQDSPVTATSGAQGASSAANQKDQAGGYYESTSFGRSSEASKAYLESLRAKQAGITAGGATATQGYMQAQQQGAQQLAKLGAGYGAQAGTYDRFGAGAQAATVARQQAASDYLYGVGKGTQPSVAQLQMRQGQEQALQSQLALAGSGRGGSSGAMLDQALRQNAATQQQLVTSGAMARAAESQQAMQTAAAIDASRYGQQAQSAGLGMQYSAMQGQAAQGALAARAAAYSGGADIDLAYQGLGRSYEDLVYGQGTGESERYTSALTGKAAQEFQRSMANTEYDRQQNVALFGAGSQLIGTGINAYYRGQS